MTAMKRRRDRIGEINLPRTLKPLAFFPSDPTVQLSANGFDRATRTPDGEAIISVVWSNGYADTTATGPGADYLLDNVPALLGLDDDVESFRPTDPVVARLWRQFPGLRVCASHTLWHDVAWLIPGQRVTTADAARQWACIARGFGEPTGVGSLRFPPTAETIAELAYHELHRCGLERKRASALIAAARRGPRFERDTHLAPAQVRRRLETIPGIGPWMSTNVVTMTCGAADEVVLGDYGQPSYVTWALAGERVGNDERMLELLEPFRPHRWRVVRLIMSAGISPPRHGPRLRNPRIERL